MKKFLIIRRDNIGDLVCTTPLIRALRQKFPDAYIAALVNSYNAPVLENNPEIDRVYAYTKAKHRLLGQSLLSVYWARWKMFQAMRAERFDYAVIASIDFVQKPLRLARQVKPQHIVGFVEAGDSGQGGIDMPVPHVRGEPMHMVKELEALASPFGIQPPLPAMSVWPDPAAVAGARERLAGNGFVLEGAGRPVGIHISARKLPQRWSADSFVALMRKIHAEYGKSFLLFWSPGDEHNPSHPGDDGKARAIMEAVADLPVQAFPTGELRELIAGMSLCERVVCSDGGAMHIAAALGKPIVCFFGNSDARMWYPWGVPHVLLQKPSQDVGDISVDEAFSAYRQLLAMGPATD